MHYCDNKYAPFAVCNESQHKKEESSKENRASTGVHCYYNSMLLNFCDASLSIKQNVDGLSVLTAFLGHGHAHGSSDAPPPPRSTGMTVIGFCSMSIGYTIQALIGEYRSHARCNSPCPRPTQLMRNYRHLPDPSGFGWQHRHQLCMATKQ